MATIFTNPTQSARRLPTFAQLAAALEAQGYLPGIPPTVPSDAASIDQHLIEGRFCASCCAQTIQYRPYRRHGATAKRGKGVIRHLHWSYRAFGVCSQCGGWFEF